MLREKFPNLDEFLRSSTEAFNGGFQSDNGTRMDYKMQVMYFGNHMGDNWLIFEESFDGYSLSIESKVGSKVKVKSTLGRKFTKDLSFDEWKHVVDELLMIHAQKPEYMEFAGGIVSEDVKRKQSGQATDDSGCLLLMIIGVSLTSTLFMIT